jgi:hypothetical protein
MRKKAFWVAVIDIDGFLVPVAGRSVPAILRDRECTPALTANWVVYGANGQLRKEPGLVMERFRNHTSWDDSKNGHTKATANPRAVRWYGVPDHVYRGKYRSRNVLGRQNDREFWNYPAVFQVLRINHYWSKSRKEFQAKRSRGLSDNRNRKMAWNLLQVVDQQIAATPDVIAGDLAIEWAIPLVQNNLGNRSLPRPIQKFHRHE